MNHNIGAFILKLKKQSIISTFFFFFLFFPAPCEIEMKKHIWMNWLWECPHVEETNRCTILTFQHSGCERLAGSTVDTQKFNLVNLKKKQKCSTDFHYLSYNYHRRAMTPSNIITSWDSTSRSLTVGSCRAHRVDGEDGERAASVQMSGARVYSTRTHPVLPSDTTGTIDTRT